MKTSEISRPVLEDEVHLFNRTLLYIIATLNDNEPDRLKLTKIAEIINQTVDYLKSVRSD